MIYIILPINIFQFIYNFICERGEGVVLLFYILSAIVANYVLAFVFGMYDMSFFEIETILIYQSIIIGILLAIYFEKKKSS